jgi:hypothetical protein
LWLLDRQLIEQVPDFALHPTFRAHAFADLHRNSEKAPGYAQDPALIHRFINPNG